MKLITVFTPAYNRGYCLGQLYDSLITQTNHNFIWLIIDDGSSDNTKELVATWQNENKIEIQYIYQENQGMHGAHNTAYKNIKTELNVCIDSDDFMPNNAIDIICNNYNDLDDNFAGLVGLDADKKGDLIGTIIPTNLTKVKLFDLDLKYKVKGDMKLVFKTKVIKKYPEYPIFKGENFVPLSYKYLLIDQDYYLKPINEILCIVEYLEDGSTRNIFSQYKKNPQGFAFSRVNEIKFLTAFKIQHFKSAIHLVSSCLFLKNFELLKKINKPFLVGLAFPFGVLLYIYIGYKIK